jgi:CPA1 family monovalent cation:H+ antiporter
LRRAEADLARGETKEGGVELDTEAASTAADDSVDHDVAAVRAAAEAQRRQLVALRADGTIGDAAFQRVEEELDWAELDWSQVIRSR